MIERVTLGDVTLSRIVYGMWRLGDDANTAPAHVQAKIEACLDQGITTMDQADIYGGYTAEAILGAALRAAPALRDRIEIVSKCDIVAPVGRYADRRIKHYDTSPAHIRASVETSLREMATDRIDLLLLHRPDPLMDHHATGRALDDLVTSGKVLAVGVSNFRPWDWELLQSAMTTPLVTNQIELSLMARDAYTNGDIAHLQRIGVRPMAWSPLAGGAMFGDGAAARRLAPVLARVADAAGVTPDAVAVAWLLAHPCGILPVMGTNNLARIARLGDAARVTIDRETWFELWTAAAGAEVP